ncbi:MAG TPA: DUF1353 domain-containing protein [Ramlibacter sp.]|nr:DUF1353 domain-containing protein [Ramlibacter sp.]
MSGFITPLDTRKLGPGPRGRSIYKLLADLVYSSDRLGRQIRVPAGFVTDYASVPRLPLAFLVAGDTAHEAAVVHDWLYTTHEVGRAQADAVFKEAIQASDPGAPAGLMWLAVRLGGGGSWDAPGPSQPAHVAEQLVAQPYETA